MTMRITKQSELQQTRMVSLPSSILMMSRIFQTNLNHSCSNIVSYHTIP
jgi:hypothetical protein